MSKLPIVTSLEDAIAIGRERGIHEHVIRWRYAKTGGRDRRGLFFRPSFVTEVNGVFSTGEMLEERYGVTSATLRKRFKAGLRGDALVSGQRMDAGVENPNKGGRVVDFEDKEYMRRFCQRNLEALVRAHPDIARQTLADAAEADRQGITLSDLQGERLPEYVTGSPSLFAARLTQQASTEHALRQRGNL
jgi:hypothetical protein